MKNRQEPVTKYFLTCLILSSLCIVKEILAKETIKVCPPKCKCIEKTRQIICQPSRKDKQKMTYIPRLPIYTRYLKFNGNKLYHIYKKTFVNLTDVPLRTLILQNCYIHLIEPDAFKDLKHLNHLEINQNFAPFGQLSGSFQSLNKSLIRILGMKYNYWTDLLKTMFKYLNGSLIEQLFLNGNNLKTFNGTILSGLTKLKGLSLASNQYYFSISFKGMPPSIQKFDLSNNYFRDIPKFCDKSNSLLPELTELRLDKNNIEDIKSSSISCLSNLRILSLDGNRLSIINDNAFQHLVSLEVLSISRQNSFIRTIKPYAFNSSSRLKLRFKENNFAFKRLKQENIFNGCPNLEFLDMSKTGLNLGYGDIGSMFLPLRKLQDLILVAAQMSAFPSDVFPHMVSLKKLRLGGNHISGWNDDPKMFGNSTSLKFLDLSGNDIQLINKTSFPEKLLSSLTRLNLAGNPFTCSCELRWFRDWIRLNKTKLDDWGQGYICVTPPEMADTKLIDFNPTSESCKEPNLFIFIVQLISVVCVSGIITAIILYKCRWHIRYWIYLLRVKKRRRNNVDNRDLGFQFDAFVVYSEEDRQWVHDILIPELEQKQGYQLCLHLRDFDVGRLIVDNIVENMEQSRKILIVLSNALAKSDWCQFEIRISQDRILNDADNNDAVLVLLEEINHRNLTSMLKAMITTTTYAVWTDNATGQKQFWDQIEAGLEH